MTRQSITGVIRKIHLYYFPHNGGLMGMRFFDADGNCIYESDKEENLFDYWIKKHEIFLNEGERIILLRKAATSCHTKKPVLPAKTSNAITAKNR